MMYSIQKAVSYLRENYMHTTLLGYLFYCFRSFLGQASLRKHVARALSNYMWKVSEPFDTH